MNVHTAFSTAWLVTNFLVGIAAIPGMLWAARRYGYAFEGSPFMQQLIDDLAGRRSAATARFIRELREFEGRAA